jgi:hypothetical protein
MTNISSIESLVDRYVECWKRHRPEYSGLWEDNDFGCESLQVFRNGYQIETFSHRELCDLSVLLTRSLRGQINRDHKVLWSWCSFITFELRQQVQMLNDSSWTEAFRSLVNLLLVGWKEHVAGLQFLAREQEALRCVNFHTTTATG